MTLEALSKGRKNNLDWIRFISACGIVIWHAFSVNSTTVTDARIKEVTGGFSAGAFFVCVFFFISGFLNLQSAERRSGLRPFFTSRLSRLLPSLAVVVVLSAFVLGPLVSTVPFGAYFRSAQTWKYLLNIILIPQYHLPGIFPNNINGTVMNGVLWTLPVEFVCYVLCFLLVRLRLHKKKTFFWTVPVVVIGSLLIIKRVPGTVDALRAMFLFYIGAACYIYRSHIVLRRWQAVCAAIVLGISFPLKIALVSMVPVIPVLVLFFAFFMNKKKPYVFQKAEASYGMYLCGAPIQNTVVHLAGGSLFLPWTVLLVLPLDILCGYLLNRYIDKPIRRFFH